MFRLFVLVFFLAFVLSANENLRVTISESMDNNPFSGSFESTSVDAMEMKAKARAFDFISKKIKEGYVLEKTTVERKIEDPANNKFYDSSDPVVERLRINIVVDMKDVAQKSSAKNDATEKYDFYSVEEEFIKY